MAGPHAGNRNRPAYSGQARFRFPKQIVELFAPRKAIEFKAPVRKRKLRRMTGVAALVHKLREVTEADEEGGRGEGEWRETPAQRRRRVREEKLLEVDRKVEEGRKEWKKRLKADRQAEEGEWTKTRKAVNTLFVSNVAYATTELRMREQFEAFGKVVAVVMPKDREGVARGYAFVEFERERAMEEAYRQANGMKLDGRRLVVDVERGRTVKGWFPNRLDGPNNSAARSSRRARSAHSLAP